MLKPHSRRSFLRSAPLAAAAGLALSEPPLPAQPPAPAPVPFQYFPDAKITAAIKTLQATPGNDNLFAPPTLPVAVVLTTETAKSAKEFEWHEGRDHVVQILDGTCIYEVGGAPEGAHSSKPSEWNAPTATGVTKLTLHKGDMLIIPRGTLHKRSTETTVTFYLISTTGTVTT